jgi:hypothetical protein
MYLDYGVVLRPTTCTVGSIPGLSISQPLAGFVVVEGQPLILSAEALDIEDGDLSTTIHWISDVSGSLGIGSNLEVTLLPGGQTLTATVTDSNGNSVSHSITGTVLLNHAPTLAIYSLYDGFTIDAGDPLLLHGYADDQEDGELTTEIQWVSNIDGLLGTGSNFYVTLTPGEHTLTVSVTDQWDKTTQSSISITVVAMVCDIDGDLTVDIEDIHEILQAWNQPAGADDSRDIDKDGLITILDARQCVLQCTNPRCIP